ncbi:hypothetical protein [uncultured Stenotrophomonas sp.]|uniref:hypothetical protein n=1 Tax=uncultured Stenotrophomonas sp. TaxID=165438 RepID=UPI0026015965|nr:hypothetical protein [uncultured Stenotrophomonas sp.]
MLEVDVMGHNEQSQREAATCVESAAPVRPVCLVVAATLTAMTALLAGVNSLFVPFAPPHQIGRRSSRTWGRWLASAARSAWL